VIIRQVRCTVAEGDLPAFLQHAREVVSSHVGRVDGLVLLELAIRHVGEGKVNVIAQSHWRDFAAMQSYLQQNLYRPALWDPENRWLSEATVEHFEVVERESTARAEGMGGSSAA
jgi:heme-degrading monooxygenase HmoA